MAKTRGTSAVFLNIYHLSSETDLGLENKIHFVLVGSSLALNFEAISPS